MSSDNDFFVLRRFGKVGARVLLYMQDQIVELEEELRKQDDFCKSAPKELADSGTFRGDQNSKRRDIMRDLSVMLDRYQRFLLDHSRLKSCPNASEFQIKNVRNWFEASNDAIVDKEREFIDVDGDLIPIVPKLKTPLHRFFDRFEILKRISCLKDRKRNEKLYDSEDFERQTTIYNKDSRIDKFVTCATIAIGLAMLLVPLWLLQYFTSHKTGTTNKLWIITAFLIGFAVLFSILTVARPFEVLAATAAYGAVLMVFMQLQYNGAN